MSLSVPLEPPTKEILHISAHYLVIPVKYIYIYIQFKFIFKHKKTIAIDVSNLSWPKTIRYGF